MPQAKHSFRWYFGARNLHDPYIQYYMYCTAWWWPTSVRRPDHFKFLGSCTELMKVFVTCQTMLQTERMMQHNRIPLLILCCPSMFEELIQIWLHTWNWAVFICTYSIVMYLFNYTVCHCLFSTQSNGIISKIFITIMNTYNKIFYEFYESLVESCIFSHFVRLKSRLIWA